MVSSFLDRVVLRVATSRHLDRLAIRALLRANELLGLAMGIRLAKLRESGDRLAEVFAGAEVSAVQARLFAEAADILRERWDQLPERRRPHYRPVQRYRILRIRALLGLSAADAARWFRVSSDTILRWERDVDLASSDDCDHPAEKLVRTSPPVRRYADVVRSLVQSMALVGFGDRERSPACSRGQDGPSPREPSDAFSRRNPLLPAQRKPARSADRSRRNTRTMSCSSTSPPSRGSSGCSDSALPWSSTSSRGCPSLGRPSG